MTREIVIDTETTGLNHRLGDRIIEVACVELYNHVTTGKTLQFYCSTEKKNDRKLFRPKKFSAEIFPRR